MVAASHHDDDDKTPPPTSLKASALPDKLLANKAAVPLGAAQAQQQEKPNDSLILCLTALPPRGER